MDSAKLHFLTKGLLLFTVALLLFFGWKGLCSWSYFSVHSVVLEGDIQQVSYAQVKAILEKKLTGNLLGLDLARLQQAFAQHPWIRSVALYRSWPNRIVAQIEEHQPQFRWRDSHLLNHYGEVFAGQQPQHDALPMLWGPNHTQIQLLQAFHQLSALVTAPLSITRMALDAQGAYEVVLSNGWQLILGQDYEGDLVTERVARFFRVLPKVQEATQLKAIERVDLRYPNGFSVRMAS